MSDGHYFSKVKPFLDQQQSYDRLTEERYCS